MKVRKFGRTMTVMGASLCMVISGATVAEAAPGRGEDRIRCTVTLDNPHQSGPANGTISAEGRVTCTKTVKEIYIKTSIRQVVNNTVASQTFDSFNVSSGSSVGARPCSDGPATFMSQADVRVDFPTGYKPTQQTASEYSPNVSVACGDAKSVTGTTNGVNAVNSDTATWTITAVKN
ncbi:hypothetical protein ACVLV4_000370 [Rathayibacter agropyri]